MKLFSYLILAAIACFALTTVSVAQEGAVKETVETSCCSKDKDPLKECACDDSENCKCESKESCTCKKSCAACDVKTAMAKLPKLSYSVAGEEACCHGSATSLAKTKSAPIEYVVASKAYETKEAAYTAMIEQTEAMVKEFSTPCKCEVSGNTKIAGTTCHCPVKAGETAKRLQEIVQGVQMTYAVGEETCSCPNQAQAMAKAAGSETAFIVDGKKTTCEMTARLNLARAKYRAAVEAMARQNHPAEAEGAESTGT